MGRLFPRWSTSEASMIYGHVHCSFCSSYDQEFILFHERLLDWEKRSIVLIAQIMCEVLVRCCEMLCLVFLSRYEYENHIRALCLIHHTHMHQINTMCRNYAKGTICAKCHKPNKNNMANMHLKQNKRYMANVRRDPNIQHMPYRRHQANMWYMTKRNDMTNMWYKLIYIKCQIYIMKYKSLAK
jgi:hypothetical protein